MENTNSSDEYAQIESIIKKFRLEYLDRTAYHNKNMYNYGLNIKTFWLNCTGIIEMCEFSINDDTRQLTIHYKYGIFIKKHYLVFIHNKVRNNYKCPNRCDFTMFHTIDPATEVVFENNRLILINLSCDDGGEKCCLEIKANIIKLVKMSNDKYQKFRMVILE